MSDKEYAETLRVTGPSIISFLLFPALCCVLIIFGYVWTFFIITEIILVILVVPSFIYRTKFLIKYIEWRDDEGIFHLRAAKSSASGCGVIIINGEEIPASFSIGTNKPYFSVSISIEAAEKLGYDNEYNTSGGVAFDGFWPNYSKSDQVITSRESDVELFGVKIGKVRLKAYPIDKSEFKIWEIRSTWSDSDNKLRIDNIEGNYFLYKCLRAETTLSNGRAKYLTFRWLDESSGFRIYDKIEEEDYKNITDDTPYLAEGTYELDVNNIKLYFNKDEVLGVHGQSLYLTEKV